MHAGSKPAVLLEDILMKPTLVQDIKRASPGSQTSSLEGFHSLVNHFAPKKIGFDWLYLLTR